MSRSVHQFLPALREGEAIGEEALAIRSLLRAAGFDSEIFLEDAAASVSPQGRPLASLPAGSDELLLVHHEVGNESAGLLASLPARKILFHHDPAPGRFFAHDPRMAERIERGRRQLLFYVGRMQAVVAGSRHSAGVLESFGFERPAVFPSLFALASELRSGVFPGRPAGLSPVTVLSAGRLAPGAGMAEVLKTFDRLARLRPDASLLLAGRGPSDPAYLDRLRRRVEGSRNRLRIEIREQVDRAELARCLAAARLYLSMSAHEAFAPSVTEALASGVPVLAWKSDAVAETLGGAGILLSGREPHANAALMDVLLGDETLRRRILAEQRRRLEDLDLPGLGPRLIAWIEEQLARPSGESPRRVPRRPLRVRIEGPFETSYGLAVANRNLAEALEEHTPHRVSIRCMEGTGDYSPRGRDLEDKPLARELWERSFDAGLPDVAIRNTYPPRFQALDARLNLFYFFWEDSELPPDWAASFRRHASGILAPSAFVRDLLHRAGVRIPIEVVPPPVRLPADAARIPPAPLPTTKRTRFLSIGSAFPRKGVDVLLRAFTGVFSAKDDVVLVLKTFPNIHNTVAEQVAAARERDPACPEILHIDRDVPLEELLSLYKAADALVHPARAEGFGLPVAEAMALGLPVIATAAGGLADFCSDDTAFVIPHRMAPSGSHFGVAGAQWAEPDAEALGRRLREFADGSLREQARSRAAAARRLIEERFSSLAVARRCEEAIDRLRAASAPPSVGLVSTWKTRCGIAEYSSDLARAIPSEAAHLTILGNRDGEILEPDGPDVLRVWSRGEADYSAVRNAALEREVDTVHFQFHPGFFPSYRPLSRVIQDLKARGLRIVMTLHVLAFQGDEKSLDALRPALAASDLLLVHSGTDLERLREAGFGDRSVQIAFGGHVFAVQRREARASALGLGSRRVFASFGFALPHKGILEAIEATAILRRRFPSILFLALASARPEPVSPEYLARCRERVTALGLQENVWILDGFLSEPELELLLGAAELVVLPYLDTKETASAAIRYPLGAGRATITTSQPIFADARSAILQVPSADPTILAEAVTTVLEDSSLRERLESEARRYSRKNSWPAVAGAHADLYRRVRGDPQTDDRRRLPAGDPVPAPSRDASSHRLP